MSVTCSELRKQNDKLMTDEGETELFIWPSQLLLHRLVGIKLDGACMCSVHPKNMKEPWFSDDDVCRKQRLCVCSLSPCEQTTRWEHVGDPVRITGQQEESILPDRWMAGVQEWEKVKMGETQSFPHWLSVRFLRVLNRRVLPRHGQGRLRGDACGSPGDTRL